MEYEKNRTFNYAKKKQVQMHYNLTLLRVTLTLNRACAYGYTYSKVFEIRYSKSTIRRGCWQANSSSDSIQFAWLGFCHVFL